MAKSLKVQPDFVCDKNYFGACSLPLQSGKATREVEFVIDGHIGGYTTPTLLQSE